MGFLSLRVYNFRNLVNAVIPLGSRIVFLVGENGQGKTNLLEALYLLCFGSSFRTRNDDTFKAFGCSEMGIAGEYSSGTEGPLSVDIRITGREKRIFLNGKRISDRKELVSSVPCIVFCHSDIEFITGAPDRRRWFFNQVMSMHDPLFINTLRDYQKIIVSRNAVLKDGPANLLDVYDRQLAAAGLPILRKRAETVENFNFTFSPLFKRISGLPDNLTLRYSPSWKNAESEENILDALKHSRERDLIFGTTTTGVHRDRFSFYLGDRNFSKTASTGQTRLASLALRAAQACYLAERTGKPPVLLLDDVLLELDGKKRVLFLEVLPEFEQAFFTFLPDEPYNQYIKEKTLVYRVSEGAFSER